MDDDVGAVVALPDGNDFGAVVVTGDPRVDGGGSGRGDVGWGCPGGAAVGAGCGLDDVVGPVVLKPDSGESEAVATAGDLGAISVLSAPGEVLGGLSKWSRRQCWMWFE